MTGGLRRVCWSVVLALGVSGLNGCGGSGSAAEQPPAPASGECGNGVFTGCEAKCDAGDGYSCLMLGNAQSLGRAPGGKVKATEAYEKGCALKETAACENLGTALANGWNGAPDPVRAFGYQQDACDGGSLNGCYNLANYYLMGLGTEQDYARAAAILRSRVCVAQETEDDVDLLIVMLKGCKTLGKMLAQGLGAPQDLKGAQALLSLVCEMGPTFPPDLEMNGFTYDDACEGKRILEGGE